MLAGTKLVAGSTVLVTSEVNGNIPLQWSHLEHALVCGDGKSPTSFYVIDVGTKKLIPFSNLGEIER